MRTSSRRVITKRTRTVSLVLVNIRIAREEVMPNAAAHFVRSVSWSSGLEGGCQSLRVTASAQRLPIALSSVRARCIKTKNASLQAWTSSCARAGALQGRGDSKECLWRLPVRESVTKLRANGDAVSSSVRICAAMVAAGSLMVSIGRNCLG